MASGQFHVVPRELPPELAVRAAVAAAVAFVAFGIVGVRLWYLQVEQGAAMREMSENNRIRLVRVPAARGVVYDRHGEILVDNRPSFDVVFVPEDARHRRRALRNLAGYLGEEERALHAVASAPSKRPPYEGIVLRRDVDWSGVVALETHQLDLPGVSLQVGPKRYYPFGPMAAHLLGYVGEVSESELSNGAATGYRLGDLLGKAGLEKAWEGELRGVAGGQQVEVDALGRRVRVLQEVPDLPGGTLTLTLDRDLQETAEDALGEADGSIVALDPRNGEILAMVSHPAYDPNVFARGIRPAEWRDLIQHPKRPLNNRAVQGQYPPGSTFKVAMAAAVLEKGLVMGSSCSGGIPFGNHFFRCWRKEGHGHVNLHSAVVQSCDVFFYQAGQRLGIDTIAEYARRLGLGVQTGIRIGIDPEKEGTIPDSAWKRRRFKQPWYAGETLSVAIGQGYVTASPLQMAVMTATIANGGTRYRPQFVKRVEGADGTLLREIQPEVLGNADLKKSTIAHVHAAMRDVVMSERGTGKKARVAGVEIAGKTGTSQVVKMGEDRKRSNLGAETTRDHAWFVAFAPVEAPEIVVSCIVEHAGAGGGAVAAPVVQRVLERYFTRNQGPVPDGPAVEAHAVRPPADHAL
jgi:penicillin-binding protein 2